MAPRRSRGPGPRRAGHAPHRGLWWTRRRRRLRRPRRCGRTRRWWRRPMASVAEEEEEVVPDPGSRGTRCPSSPRSPTPHALPCRTPVAGAARRPAGRGSGEARHTRRHGRRGQRAVTADARFRRQRRRARGLRFRLAHRVLVHHARPLDLLVPAACRARRTRRVRIWRVARWWPCGAVHAHGEQRRRRQWRRWVGWGGPGVGGVPYGGPGVGGMGVPAQAPRPAPRTTCPS